MIIDHFHFDEIKQFFTYWREMTPEAYIPAKHNLDPTKIPKLLPYIWLCSRDSKHNTFMYNLVGDVVRNTINRPMRGRFLNEIFNAEWSERLNARYQRVCEEPAMYHGCGKVYGVYEKKSGVGERLILPLMGESGQIDHVVGLTFYLLVQKDKAPDIVINAAPGESGEYIPLPCAIPSG